MARVRKHKHVFVHGVCYICLILTKILVKVTNTEYQEYSSSRNRFDTIGQTDIWGDSAKLIVAYLSRRQLNHLHKWYILYSFVYVSC
jgi:hypothetical protein